MGMGLYELKNKLISELRAENSYIDEDMKKQIENITKLGRISKEISKEHKGFNEWILVASRRDHQTILQVHTLYSLSHELNIL